jgi:hypothetical protein
VNSHGLILLVAKWEKEELEDFSPVLCAGSLQETFAFNQEDIELPTHLSLSPLSFPFALPMQ